jgi:hypothetical protein
MPRGRDFVNEGINDASRQGDNREPMREGNPAFQNNGKVGSRRRVAEGKAAFTWKWYKKAGLQADDLNKVRIESATGWFNRNNIEKVYQQIASVSAVTARILQRESIVKYRHKSRKASLGAQFRNNWVIYVRWAMVLINHFRASQQLRGLKFPQLMGDDILQAMYHAKDETGNDCPLPPSHYIAAIDPAVVDIIFTKLRETPEVPGRKLRAVNIFDSSEPPIPEAPFYGRNVRELINFKMDTEDFGRIPAMQEFEVGRHYWPYRYADNAMNIARCAFGVNKAEWDEFFAHNPQILQRNARVPADVVAAAPMLGAPGLGVPLNAPSPLISTPSSSQYGGFSPLFVPSPSPTNVSPVVTPARSTPIPLAPVGQFATPAPYQQDNDSWIDTLVGEFGFETPELETIGLVQDIVNTANGEGDPQLNLEITFIATLLREATNTIPDSMVDQRFMQVWQEVKIVPLDELPNAVADMSRQPNFTLFIDYIADLLNTVKNGVVPLLPTRLPPESPDSIMDIPIPETIPSSKRPSSNILENLLNAPVIAKRPAKKMPATNVPTWEDLATIAQAASAASSIPVSQSIIESPSQRDLAINLPAASSNAVNTVRLSSGKWPKKLFEDLEKLLWDKLRRDDPNIATQILIAIMIELPKDIDLFNFYNEFRKNLDPGSQNVLQEAQIKISMEYNTRPGYGFFQQDSYDMWNRKLPMSVFNKQAKIVAQINNDQLTHHAKHSLLLFYDDDEQEKMETYFEIITKEINTLRSENKTNAKIPVKQQWIDDYRNTSSELKSILSGSIQLGMVQTTSRPPRLIQPPVSSNSSTPISTPSSSKYSTPASSAKRKSPEESSVPVQTPQTKKKKTFTLDSSPLVSPAGLELGFVNPSPLRPPASNTADNTRNVAPSNQNINVPEKQLRLSGNRWIETKPRYSPSQYDKPKRKRNVAAVAAPKVPNYMKATASSRRASIQEEPLVSTLTTKSGRLVKPSRSLNTFIVGQSAIDKEVGTTPKKMKKNTRK